MQEKAEGQATEQAERWRALQTESQTQLIEFLRSDLALAFTMLDTARLSGSEKHRQSAAGHARESLATVRGFLARVEDPKQCVS